jgi:hypothetical protein
VTAPSTSSTSYRPHPQVVHETIDGEVILIQIDTGCYYSLAGSGPEIWELLVGGRELEAIARALEGRYEADPQALRAAVTRLVEELHSETLVEPAVAASNATNGHVEAKNGHARAPLAPPVLEKYEDMQDFLLVDPIHEVEDTGWPHKKTG